MLTKIETETLELISMYCKKTLTKTTKAVSTKDVDVENTINQYAEIGARFISAIPVSDGWYVLVFETTK